MLHAGVAIIQQASIFLHPSCTIAIAFQLISMQLPILCTLCHATCIHPPPANSNPPTEYYYGYDDAMGLSNQSPPLLTSMCVRLHASCNIRLFICGHISRCVSTTRKIITRASSSGAFVPVYSRPNFTIRRIGTDVTRRRNSTSSIASYWRSGRANIDRFKLQLENILLQLQLEQQHAPCSIIILHCVGLGCTIILYISITMVFSSKIHSC